jgi:putative ABC transport system substrate-binding protein
VSRALVRVIVIIALFAVPLAAGAQQAGKIFRVALVFTTTLVSEMAGPIPADPDVRRFLDELRALGYMEGQNLALDRRSGEGKPDQYPAVIAEVVGLGPDIIVTVGDRMTETAKRATTDIPIVMLAADPVGTGLVRDLARPDTNITG